MRPAGTVLLGALALAACSGEKSGEAGPGGSPAAAAEKQLDRIACALSGQNLEKRCTREVASGPDGPIWIIRHPDGSFRRFVIIDGGQRIATADGADEVRTERGSDYLDVFVAGEQYRFEDSHVAER